MIFLCLSFTIVVVYNQGQTAYERQANDKQLHLPPLNPHLSEMQINLKILISNFSSKSICTLL